MKHFMDIVRVKESDDDMVESNVGAFQVGDHIQISEKWDGANSSIAWENGELKAYSRKNELNMNNNLRGFWNFVQTLDKEMFRDLGNRVLFGEWGVPHTVKYNQDAYNKWYVYDMFDKDTEHWLSQTVVKEYAESHGLEYIHVLYDGPFISWEHCKTFLNQPAYGNQQEGCFSSRTKILMADDSEILIKDVKVGDIVKSYNLNTHCIENKKVTNVFFNGHKSVDQWKQMNVFCRGFTARGLISGKTTVTKNHKFFDGNGFTEIDKLDSIYHYELTIDPYRYQACIGLMCSDGCLSKYLFKISQKEDKMQYFETLLEPFLNPKRQINISGKGSRIKNITIQKAYSDAWFTKYILKHNKLDYISMFRDFNDIGWAYFFMGDGSGKKNSLNLCLASYTQEEVNEIVKILKEYFEIKCLNITYDKRVFNGSGASIWLSGENANKIFNRIAKYIVPTHRYKLPENIEQINENQFTGFPNCQYGIVKRHIYKNIDFVNSNYCENHQTIGAWDLEVEDNHNYFANGCLVHNCVIKNQDKLNDPDNRNPFYLKIVNDSFKETQLNNHIKKILDPNDEIDKAQAEECASQVITEARVRKDILKMVDEGLIPEKLTPQDMGLIARLLPKRMYDDVLKEEKELVGNCIANKYFGKAISSQSMNWAKKIVLGS